MNDFLQNINSEPDQRSANSKYVSIPVPAPVAQKVTVSGKKLLICWQIKENVTPVPVTPL
jgi:hypothetical protein